MGDEEIKKPLPNQNEEETFTNEFIGIDFKDFEDEDSLCFQGGDFTFNEDSSFDEEVHRGDIKSLFTENPFKESRNLDFSSIVSINPNNSENGWAFQGNGCIIQMLERKDKKEESPLNLFSLEDSQMGMKNFVEKTFQNVFDFPTEKYEEYQKNFEENHQPNLEENLEKFESNFKPKISLPENVIFRNTTTAYRLFFSISIQMSNQNLVIKMDPSKDNDLLRDSNKQIKDIIFRPTIISDPKADRSLYLELSIARRNCLFGQIKNEEESIDSNFWSSSLLWKHKKTKQTGSGERLKTCKPSLIFFNCGLKN